MYKKVRIVYLTLALLVGANGARSETAPASVADENEHKPSAESTATPPRRAERVLLWSPKTELYAPYIADPHRSGLSLQRMVFSKTEIADAGTSRFGLKGGGRAGVFRIHPKNDPGRGWQLSVEGAFYGQFDADRSEDNIGWDGIFALTGAYRIGKALAFKFGTLHTSSHVGDEHAERTGRRRIGYTRAELVAGVSWSIRERWRTYAEVGWGYDLRNEAVQEPGRLQFGLEYEAPTSWWKDRVGWYAAMDVSATEERDWDTDTNVQIGFVLRSGERHWRLGLERYNGRSLMGEFFQDDERYTALSLWVDL